MWFPREGPHHPPAGPGKRPEPKGKQRLFYNALGVSRPVSTMQEKPKIFEGNLSHPPPSLEIQIQLQLSSSFEAVLPVELTSTWISCTISLNL